MEILKSPNPILLAQSEPVEEITEELQHLAADMVNAMYSHNGKGLAAPQIGHNIRLFVMRYGDKPLVLFNPVIDRHGRDKVTDIEGCLSIPGKRIRVSRYKIINVSFTDINGKPQSMKMRNLNARCVQHEIDHLDGILIA